MTSMTARVKRMTRMKQKKRLERRVLGLLLLAGTTGCPVNDLLKGTEGNDSGNRAPVDATTEGADAGESDGDDSGQTADAGGNGDDSQTNPMADAAQTDASQTDASQGLTYYPLDDPRHWTFFSVSGVANGTTKYSGVAFDGRYLYFVPNFSPPNVLRYDTHGGFADPTSWTYHSPMAAIGAAGGSSTGSYTCLGGAFDGRYVYLAPFGTNTYAVRYDTQQPFAQDGAWSAFNATTLDPSANYWGVLSDGRYAYFIPNKTTKVLICDSTAGGDAGSAFTAAAFSTYDLGTGNQGYWGGAFDGTYVYMAPYSGSVVARHDAILPIGAAWDVGASGFDLNNNFLLGAAAHFWGGAYDGSRVYMIPDTTQAWTLAAYTPPGVFNDYGSWTTCALGTQLFGGSASGNGFVGAAFDGKRLVLAPYGVPAGDGGGAPVPVVAYDTTQPLCPSTVSAAYAKFDPSALDGGAGAQGFEGAAFDGQYIYFVPHNGSVVARFEAKSANKGLFPPSYKGSWW
jgi:hypothetical protein